MTQEEKAIQIAKNLVGKLDDPLCSGVVEKSALYGALNIAKWQKQQMIEKACKWLQDHTELLRITDEDGNLYQEFINDFKQAMEK